MRHTAREVLECAEAYEALGEPVGASMLRAYAALLGSEPVAWRVVADASICDLLNDDEQDVLYFDKNDVPTGDEALGFTITPLIPSPRKEGTK